jgi:DNA-binding NarL/FixJ family response regulator
MVGVYQDEMPGMIDLTKREQQVLDRLVRGDTSPMIALELKVSVKRVKNIKYQIRKKFGAGCMLTAAARAAQSGAVDAWGNGKKDGKIVEY